MVRISLTIPALIVAIAIAIAGCGDDAGSSDSDASSSSVSDSSLATFASPGSVVFVGGQLKPQGELKSSVDSVTSIITGEKNLRSLIISELEDSARENGETFSYAQEVEPWLGEMWGAAFERVEGTGDLSEPLIAIETADEAATRKFVDARANRGGKPYKSSSYRGIEIKIGGSEQNAIGVFDSALVIADDEVDFKAAIDASQGDSLADEARFASAISAASKGSFADVYVDVGSVIGQSGDQIDARASEALAGAGIDRSDATVVASVIPFGEQIEVELSSNLSGERPPSDEAAELLLGSLPVDSVAAFVVSGFGEQLQEAIDSLDQSGLPPDVEPGELKSTLDDAGLDIDKITASLKDAAVFVQGNSRESLGGAMVVSADPSGEATDAIGQLGALLRSAKVPGVTAVNGQDAGFSIRRPELGGKPLVVLAKEGRIAIGYGLAQALQGLKPQSGQTLTSNLPYKGAITALSIYEPITAFVDGPAALALADALVPRSETDYWQARPYLSKIYFLALGRTTAGQEEGLATAKLIVGLSR